jgi:chromosome segregation ATPase
MSTNTSMFIIKGAERSRDYSPLSSQFRQATYNKPPCENSRYNSCRNTPKLRPQTPKRVIECRPSPLINKIPAEREYNYNEDKSAKKVATLLSKCCKIDYDANDENYPQKILQIKEDLNSVNKELESLKNQKSVMRDLLNDSINCIEILFKKYTISKKTIEEISALEKAKLVDSQYRQKVKAKVSESLMAKSESISSMKEELITRIKKSMDCVASSERDTVGQKISERIGINSNIHNQIAAMKKELGCMNEMSSYKEKSVTKAMTESVMYSTKYKEIKEKYDIAQEEISKLKALLSRSQITKLAKILEFIPSLKEGIKTYRASICNEESNRVYLNQIENLTESNSMLNDKLMRTSSKIEEQLQDIGKLNDSITKLKMQLQSVQYLKDTQNAEEKMLTSKLAHSNTIIAMLRKELELKNTQNNQEDNSRLLIIQLTDEINALKSENARLHKEASKTDELISQYKEYILTKEVESGVLSPGNSNSILEKCNKTIASLVSVILSKKCSSEYLSPDEKKLISSVIGEEKAKKFDENIDKIGKIESEFNQVTREKEVLDDKFRQTGILLKKMIKTFSKIVATIKNDNSVNHTGEYTELKEKLINYETIIEEKAKCIFKSASPTIDDLSYIKEEASDSTNYTIFSNTEDARKAKEETERYKQEICKLKQEVANYKIQASMRNARVWM